MQAADKWPGCSAGVEGEGGGVALTGTRSLLPHIATVFTLHLHIYTYLHSAALTRQDNEYEQNYLFLFLLYHQYNYVIIIIIFSSKRTNK